MFKVGDRLVCTCDDHPRLVLGNKYKVSGTKLGEGKYFVSTDTTGKEFFFEHRFKKVPLAFRGNFK